MRKTFLFRLFLSCLLTTLSCSALTEQLHFSKKKVADSYQFTYQWLDHRGDEQNMQFLLTKEAIFNRFRSFRAYKSEFAERAIFQAMRQQWLISPVAGVQVNFPTSAAYSNIEINGKDQAKVQLAYQKLSDIKQACTTAYLDDNFYHAFTTPDQIIGIKPNHVKIANNSVDDFSLMKPLILEKVSIQNIRQVTDYVLSFVQSIPYSPLESRLNSSGAGFNPPSKLLWENQGDCDSKVTLTATMLRALMPRIAMVLVFIDQHAFIGISIPSVGDDISIDVNGINYVLAEPTGPALLRLGQLAPSSEQAIYNGHYITETFH